MHRNLILLNEKVIISTNNHIMRRTDQLKLYLPTFSTNNHIRSKKYEIQRLTIDKHYNQDDLTTIHEISLIIKNYPSFYNFPNILSNYVIANLNLDLSVFNELKDKTRFNISYF